MTSIAKERAKERDGVEASELTGALDALIGAGDRSASELRRAILERLKAALGAGRADIAQLLDHGATGAQMVRATTHLMDRLVRSIYDFATQHAYPAANPTSAEHICVAAVGGYGREELAPHSDIDLLFLLPYKETPRVEQVIEFVLYMLWDLGLKVGHATRSVDECLRRSKADFTIRTSILEARYLWGERPLFDELRRRFRKDLAAGTGPAFVEAKLAERDARHQRMGDSRYVLEPNIKDGKGGLRDLQTLYWIGKYLYGVDDAAGLVKHGVLTAAEAARFAKAQNFLWSVRCHLHTMAGREEDRLTFEAQPAIAARLGYTDHAGTNKVERFMRHYYLIAKDVGDLTRIYCAALEAEHKRRVPFSKIHRGLFGRDIDGFPVESGRLSITGRKALSDDPVNIVRLFRLAQAHDLDVHPNALKLITRNLRLVDLVRDDPQANRLFLEMLTAPDAAEVALRRFNEAGVFGRFIPDFGRVVARMQHDLYHVYTVDEHTIFAIGVLNGIEAGRFTAEMPVASEVVHKVHSRRALYLALLLHDIGKGRGGNHSEIGAGVAAKLGPRLGLTEEETETVVWLVRYHLIMSNTAFRREIADPKTIADFVEIVQSVERLRLLLVLTVADIRAVGPTVWNGWKAALLRDLYFAAETALTGGLASEGRVTRVAAATEALRVALADWDDAAIRDQIALGYPAYWLAFDALTHARHARLMRDAAAENTKLKIDLRIDAARAATEITVYTPDHPGLFSKISGGIALGGANIVDAKAFTLTNGMALDVFVVQGAQAEAIERPEALARLAQRIEDALTGRLWVAGELAGRPPALARSHVFAVAPRVLIDNTASRTQTVIEVNGRDRPRLLHDIAAALTELKLQISSAHVSTYGERAVDVFYVKDLFGLKISHESKLKTIRDTLAAVLAEGPTPAPPGA